MPIYVLANYAICLNNIIIKQSKQEIEKFKKKKVKAFSIDHYCSNKIGKLKFTCNNVDQIQELDE